MEENSLQTTIKKELFVNNDDIYPFTLPSNDVFVKGINEMVDTFYTENCNELIENSISGGYDKSIFLMFVVMYFGIHLKLENTFTDDVDRRQGSNTEEKKTQIKLLMTDFIKDPIKRNMCINIFEEKFHNSFLEQKKIKNNKKDTK